MYSGQKRINDDEQSSILEKAAETPSKKKKHKPAHKSKK